MRRSRRTASQEGRVRSGAVAVILAVSVLASGCTPAEIEGSLARIAVSFEEGGPERALSDAIYIGETAVLVIGMRLGGFGVA